MNIHTWLYTIVSVVIVSLISLIGVFTFSMREERLKKLLLVFVSFAVGALYGDAFIHLLPETFRTLGMGLAPSLYVMGGILLFFFIEKAIRWSQTVIVTPAPGVHPMVPLIILIDGVHNFIDGMVIGASFGVSVPIGITTSLAVIFHEIPHEVSDFAILVHGGLSVRRALLFNFLSALTAVLG
ncbi:MAG: ZIP family metal transporter, partial [Endomicrobiales bacterium]